jgi:putative lipoic acid-binding regulatory protein
MDQDWIDNFRTKLEQHYSWPSLYMFKFIVPSHKEDELKKLFPNHIFTEKNSTQGKYVSLTMQIMASSSDAVIEVYQKASAVEGLIAL